jgi:DNA polymerase-3 subunit gamma/tau
MSYLVLARKYRPQAFAEVVGQEHVTRTLGNAFAAGRVHHAFLFCGPRGCGKTTLARIVGKALNCENRGDSAEPCGACSACVSINNGSAVDYQEMDGASNRGIDAIRELTEAVRYQPAVLRKKVYVIDEVHMLTTEAFNALLKTLEEPPPHVTFVLATTEPHKLPNTILSRCQRYDFKLVSAARLAQHLSNIFVQEHLAIEPGAVSLIVRESGGSVRDALSLCDQLISYVGDANAMTERHVAEVLGVADRSLTRTLVRALAEGDAGAALAAVEAAIERGVDEVQLARAIVRYLRDLSVLQVAPGRRSLVDATDEELEALAAEAGALDRSRVTQMFERMLRCCDELGKTLQPRLVLDCALIDVATIEPLVPLGDLLARLSELEGRLAGRSIAPVRSGGSGGTKEPPRPAAAAGASPGGRVASQPSRGAAPTVSPSRAATQPPSPDASSSVSAGVVSSAGAGAGSPPDALSSSGVASSAGAGAGSSPGASSSGTVGSASPSGATSLAGSASPSRERGASSAPSPASMSNGLGEASVPASMQPSGPVPKLEVAAAGSGPHDEAAPAARRLTIPADPEAALRAWNTVLDELHAERKVSLAALFHHARVMTWTADQLVLGFPVDDHSMGEMAKDRADELATLVRALGPDQKAVKVTVRLLNASESQTMVARSVLETTRERTSAERTKREAEAREHPITKHVLQTFGAQIKEIKTDV